jgi:hypothetical protein
MQQQPLPLRFAPSFLAGEPQQALASPQHFAASVQHGWTLAQQARSWAQQAIRLAQHASLVGASQHALPFAQQASLGLQQSPFFSPAVTSVLAPATSRPRERTSLENSFSMMTSSKIVWKHD